MTTRTLRFALTRPKVVLPTLLGVGLLAGQVSLFWGCAFLAFALWQSLRVGGAPQLDDLLRLREQKHAHRIDRLLTPFERQEIVAIDDYAKSLRRAGGDAALCEEILTQAWGLVRNAGTADASDALRALRHSLPPLAGDRAAASPPLGQRIDRELRIIDATQKEMDGLRLDDETPRVERHVA
jgi:hypothetical protein